MAKRTKKAALIVPQTREEAIADLTRFAQLHRDLALHTAAANESIQLVRTGLAEKAGPLAEEMNGIRDRIAAYWAARRLELTDGKRKSVAIGPCTIGNRTGNPKLGYPKGTEDELIDLLLRFGFEEWAVRTKRELNKEALLEVLQSESDADEDLDDLITLVGLGFEVKQDETFFIEPIEIEPADAASLGKEAA